MRSAITFLFICCFFIIAQAHAVELKAEEEQEKIEIDWNKYESAGIIGDPRQGAFEKILWDKQKRSDISALIEKMPAESRSYSIQSLKKRLLLSKMDASLIDNDIEIKPGRDLLTLRLKKLIEMGLYDDAYKLYTTVIENPPTQELAEIGILLKIFIKELSTACLDQKVFQQDYSEGDFWQSLEKICAHELGNQEDSLPSFDKSPTLQATYFDKNFTVQAQNTQLFYDFNDLERALISTKGLIRYDNWQPQKEEIQNLPSFLLSLLINDGELPETIKRPLQKEAFKRGIYQNISLFSKDTLIEKIDSLEDEQDQWKEIVEMLSTDSHSQFLAGLDSKIRQIEPAEIDQSTLIKAFSVMLYSQEKIPENWVNIMHKMADKNPENYIYLQILKSIKAIEYSKEISPDLWQDGLNALDFNSAEQLIAITSRLDKDTEYEDNPALIYEKHKGLTYTQNYVMPMYGLIQYMDYATESNQTGVVTLLVLSTFQKEPTHMYPGVIAKVLESLLSVGLIEEAQLIAREALMSVFDKTIK